MVNILLLLLIIEWDNIIYSFQFYLQLFPMNQIDDKRSLIKIGGDVTKQATRYDAKVWRIDSLTCISLLLRYCV